MAEDYWEGRAKDAEAILLTQRESFAAAIDRVKEFKTNFGIREKQGGDIDIDFEKFASNLGIEGALELRKVIDEQYNVSGVAGEKPRLKLAV